jgi:hypothetical protein
MRPEARVDYLDLPTCKGEAFASSCPCIDHARRRAASGPSAADRLFGRAAPPAAAAAEPPAGTGTGAVAPPTGALTQTAVSRARGSRGFTAFYGSREIRTSRGGCSAQRLCVSVSDL